MKSPHRHLRLPLLAAIVIASAMGLVSIYTTNWQKSDINPDLPVKGIDISAHNGDIKFHLLKDQGIDFAIIKATEGATFKDNAFTSNYLKAKGAGLKVGAYHFFRFDTPGHMQAINLIHSINGLSLDLPLAIDVEESGNPSSPSTDEVRYRLNEMVTHLHQSGYPVIIYTNKDGHSRFIENHFDSIPLWICSFTEPIETSHWTLWQYTHSGKLDGMNGNVDINAFKGSTKEFESWLTNHIQTTQY